jgi:hypothetical protein
METKLTPEQERRNMYIANHNACLLAENMKCCGICLFRIGIDNSDTIWKQILEEIAKFEAKMREIK